MTQNDMQSLNLFGLPLEAYNRDTSRSAKDIQLTIQELIQTALAADP